MRRTILPIRNSRPSPRPRNRGSVLILVVTILALMLLIGMAYIQTAKTDRLSTAGVSSNIDQVINAEIARIAQILKDDIVDTSGNFRNDTNGRESYEYPWNGSTFGTRDDAWLANTGINSSTQWPHITDIANGFLNGAGTIVTGNHTNITAGIYNSGVNWTSIATTAANADADDDGITDSKFTNSAIIWIDGVRYITAMRIIDLSSLLNINTALAQTTSSGTYDTSAAGTNAPRWLYPSELDINGFFGNIVSVGGLPNYPAELQALLRYRLGLAVAAQLPTPWGGAQESRYYFWHDGVRHGFANPANPYNKYVSLGLSEELKLRYRNGLNNPETKGTALNTHIPTFIREGTGATAETKYSDVPTIGTSIDSYLKNEPRHQMTTMSNATIISTRAATTWPARTVQVDLNPSPTGSYNAVACDTAVYTAVNQVYSIGTWLATNAVPAGGYSTASEFAYQFAVAAHDYRDADNKVTGVGAQLGFERLPFIAEVYAQRSYKATGVVTGATDSVNWQQQGTAGYAIEIRNPFNDSISLQNIKLYVNGAAFGSGDLDTLAGQTTLAAKTALVLYRDSAGGTNDSVAGLISTGVKPIAGNPDWPTDNGPVDVELRATVVGSNGATTGEWTYSKFASHGMPDTFTQTAVTTGSVAEDDTGYKQHSAQGSGNGLNVMLVTPPEVQGNLKEPNAGWQDIDKLGDDGKAIATAWLPSTEQIVWRDDSANVFWYAGEVAQMLIVPLVQTKTFAESWNHRTATSDWMLRFNPVGATYAAAELAGSNNLTIPRAALLIDRLTTMSPLTDGIDNDGDGTIDNIEEQVIPGRININTATKEMLLRVLPVTSSVPGSTSGDARERIVNAIIQYRDDATVASRPAGVRINLKGIASMGELMIPANGIAKVRDQLGLDTVDNSTIGGSVADFIPATPIADGVIDDREEQAMVLNWLNQVCTTRSDTFAAYIYIRGYDGGTFDTDHLAEVARVLVIFDRSNITDQSGQPKVLGYVRYK